MVRMILLTMALVVGGVSTQPSPAFAHDYTVAATVWEDPDNALPHPREVQIGIPREAGSQRLTELGDFNNSGGLDNIAQYRSADDEVFATVYIYRTTLADPGIAAIATDFVIRHAYGARTRLVEDRLTSIGGIPQMARMMFYEDAFDGERASLAAYARAGQWTVKLRVTGPQSRRDQVLSDALALLDGMRLGAEVDLSPPFSYAVSECPAEPGGQPAQLIDVPDEAMDAAGVGGMALALRLIGPEIEAALRGAAQEFCVLASRQIGQGAYVLAIKRISEEHGPRLILIGDAGRGFEVIEPDEPDQSEHFVAMHGLGGAPVFGPFDAHPTADQFFSLVAGGSNWLGSPSVIVSADEEGDINVELTGERAE